MKIVSAVVAVVPWERGWELHITSELGDGVTQVRTLDKADVQVQDYLETISDQNITAMTIEYRFDIPHHELIEAARKHSRQAAELQTQASAEMRQAVRCLREDGVSVTDTAAILGVSRGRVSQLVHP